MTPEIVVWEAKQLRRGETVEIGVLPLDAAAWIAAAKLKRAYHIEACEDGRGCSIKRTG